MCAQRFRDIVRKSGADILIANHTDFDGSKRKQAVLATRRPADRHPYVIGSDAVQRYVTVAEESAKAGLVCVESPYGDRDVVRTWRGRRRSREALPR
jgi:metallo-beta-lactamase class B